MLKPSVTFIQSLITLILIHNSSISQSLVPDTSSSPAYKNAVAFYNESLIEELHLFNGAEDNGYSHRFREGTPYFITENWSNGTVTYDGKRYENVSLLYDVATDELVYLYFNKIARIRLIKEKVSAFSIMGHNFIHITTDSSAGSLAPGFYDELHRGKMSLLAKRTKNIQSFISQAGEEFRVFSKDHYYIKKGNDYHPVSNRKSFLQNLSEKRKEVQQYIRQNRLNFSKDFEDAMTKTLSYYDQLIRT